MAHVTPIGSPGRFRRALSGPGRYIRTGRTALRRGLRSLVVVLAILLPATAWSYASALTAPGSAPWTARTVEWISDHGGRGLVLLIERVWYTWHQPPVGGLPPGGLPYARSEPRPNAVQPDAGHHRKTLPPHIPRPANVRPLAARPLPHEGVWQPVGPTVAGLPTGYATYLRPDNVHTSLVAALLWMDTKLLRARLYAGVQEPGGSGWRSSGSVGPGSRAQLAFTFNSGFRMRDSRGGYYSEGRFAVPLVKGAASFVIYKNGVATVGVWGRDVRMSPRVASVRQNLSLIVDHGRPVPGLATDALGQWGATLGDQVLVWRSGVGVRPDGALVYAAGPGLSVQSLARLLADAGCVRAMELDINTDWVTANSYTPAPHSALGTNPHKLLPDMVRLPDRYLVTDERDFIAMFARR